MAVGGDREIRNLAALARTGSTGRVLNLVAAQREFGSEPTYAASPFFNNKVLNRSIILKHRLRANELDLFQDERHTATKIIIPFAGDDLELGGRAVFVGQRIWTDMLGNVCGDMQHFERDIGLLQSLDQMGSLDPFLLRERLRRDGYDIAQYYFALSHGDLAGMHAFVSREISQLIAMAFGEHGPQADAYTSKLVDALLSTEVDERLEPLRRTLRLEGDAYREGMFCWRGFLYYKWTLSHLQPEIVRVVKEMGDLVLTGPQEPKACEYVGAARQRLKRRIQDNLRDIAGAVRVYDEAFCALTLDSDPQRFVQFLLQAPDMFVDLGEKVGAAAHITSFWRYRFPGDASKRAPVDEAVDIFRDFEHGLESRVRTIAEDQPLDARQLVSIDI